MKSRFTRIELGAFRRDLYILFGDIKYLQKKTKSLMEWEHLPAQEIEDAEAIVFDTREKRGAVCLLIRSDLIASGETPPESVLYNTVPHESVHVAMALLSDIGVDPSERDGAEEMLATISGNISETIIQWLKRDVGLSC